MPVSKHAQPPLDALHSHSSHDFHVKHRHHDPVFYISAPVFFHLLVAHVPHQAEVLLCF